MSQQSSLTQSAHSVRQVLTAYTGMLSENNKHLTDVERTILRSASREYDQARQIFEYGRKLFGVLALSEQTHIATGCDAIHQSLLSREMSAFFLVMSLKLMAS
jgi:hypothetical protein